MAWGKCKKQDQPLVYNSLDELLALLAEERQKSLKRRRLAKIGLSLYLGVMILVLIAGFATHFHGMGSFGNMFTGVGGMIASMYAATNTQKKGVQALAGFEDIRAVPRLIEMLEYNDKGLKTDVAMLLEKLLPRLKASDAPMLGPEHHAILNRLLAGKLRLMPHDTALLASRVLPALEQIGDESSLPIVEQLAEGKGMASHFKTAERDQLQQAARECLPALRMRADNQRQTQTLLRASDGNYTPTDVLLRPAMASMPNVSAEELLRAAPQTDTPYEPLSASLPVVNTPRVEPEQEPQIARLSL